VKKSFFFACGKKILLRPPILADAKGDWYQWFNDPETTQWLIDRFWPNSKADQIQFFKYSQQNKSSLILSVINRKNGKHVGICSLSSINWVHRFADIALVLGDKNFRKGTIAIEIIKLLLDIAFLKLNLENLKGAYVSDNIITPKLLKIFKFKTVGKFEDLCLIKNKKNSLILVQLSKKEYINSYK